MAQKATIDGTAYTISGGRSLIAGTAYTISGGKTLIDGTGYDVILGGLCAVTVTGTGNKPHSGTQNYRYIELPGVGIVVDAGEYSVARGSQIVCKVYSNRYIAKIIVDGETVESGKNKSLQYTYTTNGNATIAYNDGDLLQPGYKIIITSQT